MKQLGFERFAIVGHDRGSYTAFRTAMDHPRAVTQLAVLDGVPIIEALERCTARFAQAWWHWFFFGQLEKPERAILADPDAWYGVSPDHMGAENYADYRAAIHDPATVHRTTSRISMAMCSPCGGRGRRTYVATASIAGITWLRRRRKSLWRPSRNFLRAAT
jgi:pimeloyl-ACP methyl ester carboxylesterase